MPFQQNAKRVQCLAGNGNREALARESMFVGFQAKRAELVDNVRGAGDHSVRKIAEKSQSRQRTPRLEKRGNSYSGAGSGPISDITVPMQPEGEAPNVESNDVVAG